MLENEFASSEVACAVPTCDVGAILFSPASFVNIMEEEDVAFGILTIH